MAPQLDKPLLPPGSPILVIAANGLIASHIVDQLLLYGYAVRGTVRSLDRSSWMTPLFKARYPNSKFELVEVPDITASGCYDEALKGVSAVIATAALNMLVDDPTVIPNSIKGTLLVLDAAEKANKSGEKIKRVVYTSSSWAVVYPQPNKEFSVDVNTYNTSAGKALDDPNTPKEARGVLTYIASKTESELEAWKWVKEHKDCGFVFNTTMPSTCIGPVLAPKEQAYPSTAGFVRSLWEGKTLEFFEWLEPQWFVDVRDAARLHVAAAVLEGVENERVFGWAETYTWPGIVDVMKKIDPNRTFFDFKDKGEDLSKAPVERSTELLKRLGRDGWIGFEESVRENVTCYYPS